MSDCSYQTAGLPCAASLCYCGCCCCSGCVATVAVDVVIVVVVCRVQGKNILLFTMQFRYSFTLFFFMPTTNATEVVTLHCCSCCCYCCCCCCVHEKKGRPAAAVVAVGAAAATPTHLTGSGFASGCHCCWPGFRLSFQLYALCIRMHVCACVCVYVCGCVCVCLLEGGGEAAGACHISGKKKNMLVYCQHACAPTRRMSNVAASATFRVPCQHAEQQ